MRILSIPLLVAGLMAFISSPAAASYYGACSKHATLMLYACFADREDDYLVHRADCAYVTAAEDQRECRSDARSERREKTQECTEVYDARQDLCDLVGQARYDIEFQPGDFVDPDEIGDGVAPNPYWPLTAGHTHVIVSESRDDEGEEIKEVVVATATAEVRDVGGLPCRVIRDLAFEEDDDGEYSAVEITQDWYGQIGEAGEARGIGEAGDVVYCGENTYEVEDDLIDNTDGSFAHDTDRALAGFLVRKNPIVGTGDRQEMASDEAEDYVRYDDLNATPSAGEGGDLADPLACMGNCLKTFEVNPREPGQAEHKYYLPGTGFVLATKLEDNVPTGEREEVVCVTSSITEALDMGAACGIDDPDALRDAMCAWTPEAQWLPEDLCD